MDSHSAIPFATAVALFSSNDTQRPVRHRRGQSLPANFGSTFVPPPTPRLARRKSIGSMVQSVRDEVLEARKRVMNLSSGLEDQMKRTQAIVSSYRLDSIIEAAR